MVIILLINNNLLIFIYSPLFPMKKLPSSFFPLGLFAIILSACATPKTAQKAAAKLESGVKYEVRSALAASEAFKPKDIPRYYFSLDVPPNNTSVNDPLISDKSTERTVRTTAYCHSESDHVRYGHLTAAGGDLKFGTVCSAAADWSRYPVGTKFRIANQPGVVYQVDDYGSALVGSGTIDLYRPTPGSMDAWGVREVAIEIIEWGSYEDSVKLMTRSAQYPHVRRMLLDIQRQKNVTMDKGSSLEKASPTSSIASL